MKMISRILKLDIRKMVFDGLRYLLRHQRIKRPHLPNKFRATHLGRVGPFHRFHLYTAPPPPIPRDELQQSIGSLVKESEDRFLEGNFLEPIARQMETNITVVTASVQQGHTENPKTHFVVISPELF